MKKIVLAALSALALAAFTAPAVAQAEGPFWHVDGQKVGGHEEAQSLGISGGLSWDVGMWQFGPCMVEEGSVEVWNGEEEGEGNVDYISFDQPCPVSGNFGNLPGCHVEELALEFPLEISFAAEDGVVLNDFRASNVFGAGCAMYGIPTNRPYSFGYGDLEGTWQDGCIEYQEAGSLLQPNSQPTYVDGLLCLSSENGSVELG